MKAVSSSSSIDSMVVDDWDCEERVPQDVVMPQLQQARANGRHTAQLEDSKLGQRETAHHGPSRDFTHSFVPKTLNLAEEFSKAVEAPPTTMMIRNIPNRYTQRELIEELEHLGFAGGFDFLYSPTDFGTMGNVGYAFINFTHPDWVARFQRDLEGFVFAKHQKKSAKKAATVSVAHLQGLEANIRHYQKSALAVRARSKNCGPVIMPSRCSSVPAGSRGCQDG